MPPIHITTTTPRFLIFRNGMLGNTLMAEPFIRALKGLYPNAEMSLVVDGAGHALLQSHPQVDRLYLFDKHKDTLPTQWALVRSWRAQHFDASFHLRTGVRNEVLAFLGGVRQRVGFQLKGSWQFLTHKQAKRPQLHVLDALAAFASEALGKDVVLDAPKLFPNAEAGGKAEVFLAKNNMTPRGYLVAHLGGQTCGGLNWGPQAFAQLLTKAYEKFGLGLILIGTNAEREAAAKVLPAKPGVVHMFSQPLEVVSEVIRRAAAFVGTDSGPAHIAEAWGVPKIVAYPDDQANFARWKPRPEAQYLAIFRQHILAQETTATMLTWLESHRNRA